MICRCSVQAFSTTEGVEGVEGANREGIAVGGADLELDSLHLHDKVGYECLLRAVGGAICLLAELGLPGRHARDALSCYYWVQTFIQLKLGVSSAFMIYWTTYLQRTHPLLGTPLL